MNANKIMDKISCGARDSGMSFSEYVKANYDQNGLDKIQRSVNKGLSDNRNKIDEFRDKYDIQRDQTDFSGISPGDLDSLQLEINLRLDEKRSVYAELCNEVGITTYTNTHGPEQALA